jgi:hypothetical protein
MHAPGSRANRYAREKGLIVMPQHARATTGDIRSRPCFHLGWDRSAHTALTALGVRTWGDLAELSRETLLAVPCFGRFQLEQVEAKLAAVGLTLGTKMIGIRKINDAYSSAVGLTPVGGVYFLQCEQFVKIGHAADIRERVVDLALLSPFEMILIGYVAQGSAAESRALEKSLHVRFAALRHRLEWFRLQEPLVTFIEQLSAEYVHA